jgi:hypothetical protein
MDSLVATNAGQLLDATNTWPNSTDWSQDERWLVAGGNDRLAKQFRLQ